MFFNYTSILLHASAVMALAHAHTHQNASLAKRSLETAEKCISLNYDIRDHDGMVVQRAVHRWVRANCPLSPAISPFFRVVCSHEVVSEHSHERFNDDVWSHECEPGKFCKETQNWNDFGEYMEDIECKPLDPKSKKVHWGVEQMMDLTPSPGGPRTACSKPVEVPPRNSKGKKVGTKTKYRLHLEEQVMLENGAMYRSPDLKILDITNPYHFVKYEVKNTDTNSAQIDVYGDGVKKLQFCFVMMAGWGSHVLFHYAARDITGITGKINDAPLMQLSEAQGVQAEAMLDTGGYAEVQELP